MKHGMTKKLYMCFGKNEYDVEKYCTASCCATSFDEAKYYFEQQSDVIIYGINFVKQLPSDTDLGILETNIFYDENSVLPPDVKNFDKIRRLTMEYYSKIIYLFKNI